MHPIIQAIEDENFEEFKKLLESNPEYINETYKDWTMLSVVTQYEMSEFVEFLLEKMTPEQINKTLKSAHPLHIALENHSDIFDILIKHPKVNLNILNKSGDNLLYLVDYYNKKDFSAFLIDKGLSPFSSNNGGESAILNAIKNNDNELFDLYTQNPSFINDYSEQWIKMAIRYNAIEIFKRLQPYTDLSIDELFNSAISFEHVQIVNSILDTGDLIPGQKQITSLINLMCKNYDDEEDKNSAKKITEFLFASKIPFNKFVNEDGDSAWKLAVYNDNEEIFEQLINTNETVNITDDYQHTPLFYAIEKGNLTFVDSILKKKANINHVDKNKSTALIQAVRYGLKDIVDRLLETPNIAVNELNNNGETALSIALNQKRIDIATSLIWRGAEITKNPAKFIEDNSVFQIGITGNYEKIVEDYSEKEINNFIALNQLGFDLNKTNEKGDTLLHHFIKNGYLANFQALLKCAVSDRKVDSDGNTALMCAMKKNSDDYVLGLLWHGRFFDFTVVNNENENVYDIAAECNSVARVMALINKDDEVTEKNIIKVLPLIALSGSLEELKESIPEHIPKLDKILDSNNNNLLMLSITGNNVKNFEFLLKDNKLKFDLNKTNAKKETVLDILKKLPEDDAILFKDILKPYLKQLKNKIS